MTAPKEREPAAAAGADAGASSAELARVVREHAGRLAGSLMKVTGDFGTAEELVQDAVVAALRRWPVEGIPARPDAWLFTVARNRGLDLLRRDANYRAKLAPEFRSCRHMILLDQL